MSKILIVEDENMLLEMMCAYLQAQSYETAGTKSYDDALKQLRSLDIRRQDHRRQRLCAPSGAAKRGQKHALYIYDLAKYA